MADLLKNLPKIKKVPKFYLNLPENAGIYVFFKNNYPIYIGKSINLKRRVSSYFDMNLEPKTAHMISEAEELSFIQVGSELEALLLEARLIHIYLPKYNIEAKDDKHALYIQITKERYPRIITARRIAESQKNIAFYGPFPSSGNIHIVLRMLRRIFPYSDHKLGKRGCLYSHIGLCNPCPNIIEMTNNKFQMTNEKRRYLKNIKNIKSILDGKIFAVRSELAKEMEKASTQQDFEKAAEIRDQINKLEYITRPQMPTEFYIQNPNLVEEIRDRELRDLQEILKSQIPNLKSIYRIECFDVAHLAGTSPTASMITFIKGEPDKNFYRHFRIKQLKSQDDYASMKEVIDRRKTHLEDWGRPNLIIVDGGKGQVSVFLRELEGEKIPIVGLAKKFETLVIPMKQGSTIILKELLLPKGAGLNLIQRIRDEAHRFARTYHHKLISASLVKENL